MTASEIRKVLDQAPFQPFELLTDDGERYAVPTPDHAAVGPSGRIAAIFHDDDSRLASRCFTGDRAPLPPA